jgi:hypothetical protein
MPFTGIRHRLSNKSLTFFSSPTAPQKALPGCVFRARQSPPASAAFPHPGRMPSCRRNRFDRFLWLALTATHAQTIDHLNAHAFKSSPATLLAPDSTNRASRAQRLEAGMFKVWPTCIRRGWSLGLAASRASNRTPYWRAIVAAVSPALTVWVRCIEPVRTGREPPLAGELDPGLLDADCVEPAALPERGGGARVLT